MVSLLVVERLRKVFGGVVAVDEATFTIPPGGITALIGPNGAGKTTIFHVISGVLRPTSGRVLLNGADITGLPPHRISALGVSRTFQALEIFTEMSLADNTLVGAHHRARANVMTAGLWLPSVRREEHALRQRAEELLAWVGLTEDPNLRAGSLPFGKLRLLEIARALASEPSLLLLDEPASGLNTAESEALATLIRRIRDRGTTVLLIEHDMRFVMHLAERIIVLDQGRCIADGEPEKVREDPVVIQAYLGSRRQ